MATVGAVKTGTITEPVFEVADGGVICGVVFFTLLLTLSADFSVDLLVVLALVTVCTQGALGVLIARGKT